MFGELSFRFPAGHSGTFHVEHLYFYIVNLSPVLRALHPNGLKGYCTRPVNVDCNVTPIRSWCQLYPLHQVVRWVLRAA